MIRTRTPVRVLLNTLPKSGSVFLSLTLSKSLGIPLQYVGDPYALVAQISLEKMHVFASGSFVSPNHLAPSTENLEILDHFACRLVLHVREPRQALLSWIHHLDRIGCGDIRSEVLLWCPPRLPAGYFTWNFPRKLDWQIDNYLPRLIDWLVRWVRIHDEARIPVLLTTYGDLSDIGDLCRRICDFCGIARGQFSLVDVPKTIDNHFRLGDDSEWRRIYSSEQVERATAKLPPGFAHRFRWFVPASPSLGADDSHLVLLNHSPRGGGKF